MPESGGTKGTGLAPNIASLVCYLCPPLTSIALMLLEKEHQEVRFHAWQATVFSVGYIVVAFAINIFAIIVGKVIGFLGVLIGYLNPLLNILAIILWVVCLIKAYQGERWKIPYVGDFAEKKAGLV